MALNDLYLCSLCREWDSTAIGLQFLVGAEQDVEHKRPAPSSDEWPVTSEKPRPKRSRVFLTSFRLTQ